MNGDDHIMKYSICIEHACTFLDAPGTNPDGYTIYLFIRGIRPLMSSWILSSSRLQNVLARFNRELPASSPPASGYLLQGGGLSKIAWAFLRPLGARGECNVGVRNGDHSPSAHPSKEYKG